MEKVKKWLVDDKRHTVTLTEDKKVIVKSMKKDEKRKKWRTYKKQSANNTFNKNHLCNKRPRNVLQLFLEN